MSVILAKQLFTVKHSIDVAIAVSLHVWRSSKFVDCHGARRHELARGTRTHHGKCSTFNIPGDARQSPHSPTVWFSISKIVANIGLSEEDSETVSTTASMTEFSSSRELRLCLRDSSSKVEWRTYEFLLTYRKTNEYIDTFEIVVLVSEV